MDLSIFGIESTSTALVAVLTGVALVVLGLTTAALIGPRSYAPQKASLMSAVSLPEETVWFSSRWATICLPFCS